MADVKISGLPASTVPLAGTEVLPIVQGGSTKQVSIANVTAGRAIAATSITTDTYKAASSSGGTLQNASGTPQLQWGSGGGSNLSLEVATNINPANAAVSISPTGTGTVAISPAGALTVNPTAASTINNTSIGATTASTGRFTSVTATTGNVVIGTSGQGIDFSATAGTGTSELLADYEEGTWTPSIGGTATYTVQEGYYVKVGKIVYVRGKIVINLLGTGSTTLMSGLPYTAATGIQGIGNGITVYYFNTLAVNAAYIVGRIAQSATQIGFTINQASNATATFEAGAPFGNSARIDFSGCYQSST
jgi:hypothetical protein